MGEIITTDGARPGLDYCKITAIAAVYNSGRSHSFLIVFFFLIVFWDFTPVLWSKRDLDV